MSDEDGADIYALNVATYAGGFVLLGLVVASIGPALLMLAETTDASVADTSLLFPMRSLGYLLGSAVGGPLFDRFDGHRVLAISLTACGIGTFLIPLMKVVWAMYPLVVTQGVAMGCLDTGGNVLLIWLWGDKVAPYMQGLHFAFSVGALGSPFLVARYTHGDDVSGLKTTFWLMAALFIPLALFLLYLPSPKDPARVDGSTGDSGSRERGTSSGGHGTATASGSGSGGGGGGGLFGLTRIEISIVLIAGALLGVYVGCEVSYGGFISAYAQLYAGWEPLDGSYLAGFFWAGLAFGRLSAIPISLVLSPRAFLLVDILGCIASSSALLMGLKNSTVLIAASVFYGFFMGPIFPGTINLTETFMDVSGKAAAIFVVGASVGEMMFPLILSTIFRQGDSYYYWLMIMIVFGALAMLFTYLMMLRLGSRNIQYKSTHDHTLVLEEMTAIVPEDSSEIGRDDRGGRVPTLAQITPEDEDRLLDAIAVPTIDSDSSESIAFDEPGY